MAPFKGGVNIGHVFTVKTMKTHCYDYHGPFAMLTFYSDMEATTP